MALAVVVFGKKRELWEVKRVEGGRVKEWEKSFFSGGVCFFFSFLLFLKGFF